MATFTYIPQYGVQVDKSPRVRTAQFGDGYAQRVADGINTLPRRWSLSFEGPLADIQVIDAFLAARGGVESFDWTPVNGAAGKWVCSQWSITETSFEWQTLNCSFEEIFGE